MLGVLIGEAIKKKDEMKLLLCQHERQQMERETPSS